MPLYTKSNGEKVDTIDMADVYLQRALEKAQREGNSDNINALQEEIKLRSEQ